MKAAVVALLLCVASAAANVYFEEKFDSPSWESRWVKSTAKSNMGPWKWTAGKFYGDAEADKGIQTGADAHFYGISAKIDPAFSNKGKDLVIQFQVKHEQNIDCGGGYIKLFPSSLNQEKLDGDSEYNIMFGPDICGPGTKKVHVIFNYKGKNHLIKKEIRCKDDEFSHVYTLVVHPDNKYEVYIDLEKVESGSLEADWDFLPPKEILDPAAKKPSDWDDRRQIPDPEDTKPADWDSTPEFIPDPKASKPDDWDEESDGEWEAPMIDNPAYKGEWKPRMIDNPAYKGEWVHPKIANPDYVEDKQLYLYEDNAFVGFDLWQVKAGTIFDNVLVADSFDAAKDFANNTWGKSKDGEKKMKNEIDEKERKEREEADRKRKEEEEAKKKAEEEEDEDDDDDKHEKDEL